MPVDGSAVDTFCVLFPLILPSYRYPSSSYARPPCQTAVCRRCLVSPSDSFVNFRSAS